MRCRSLVAAHRRYTMLVTVIGRCLSGAPPSPLGMRATKARAIASGHFPLRSISLKAAARSVSSGFGKAFSSSAFQPSGPAALPRFILRSVRSSSSAEMSGGEQGVHAGKSSWYRALKRSQQGGVFPEASPYRSKMPPHAFTSCRRSSISARLAVKDPSAL